MTVFFNGLSPEQFFKEESKKLVLILNEEATKIEEELSEDTPVNTGRLRGSWTLAPATESKPTATISPTVAYFLPVEVGRAPGKGISKKGQQDVARWGQLVLGLDGKESKSLAFLLSRKYKAEGRPGVGFVGLIKPGTVPKANYKIPDNPVKGSLLDKAFARLRTRLNLGA